MKKLIIFDFDGTLMDTIEDVARCFNKTLDFFGFKTHSVEYYKSVIGGNLDVMMSRLLGEENKTDEIINKLKDKYREIYCADPKNHTKPFDGINEVLKKINKFKISIGVNTNKLQSLAENQCKHHFNDINFCGIFGYSDTRPSKPDPFAVNELIKLNNISKDDTIYVGDTLTDIQTAKNADVDCILVSWGQGDAKRLSKENKVAYIAEKPTDILDFLMIN